jgi:hypothetical protein
LEQPIAVIKCGVANAATVANHVELLPVRKRCLKAFKPLYILILFKQSPRGAAQQMLFKYLRLYDSVAENAQPKNQSQAVKDWVTLRTGQDQRPTLALTELMDKISHYRCLQVTEG